MAGGVFLKRAAQAAPGHAWLTVAAAGLLGALLCGLLPAAWLDWQPALAASQPWRAVTAAWVHWSAQHLAANAVGVLLVAALGHVARLPARAALAWALAWPLTQAGLLLRPELAHYGGLSGVLHAGVAVAALWLLLSRQAKDPNNALGPRQRWIGAAIAAGLAIKLLLEAPWGPTLRHSSEWDIAVAPLAHATGALAGTACALLLLAWPQPTRPKQTIAR